MRSMLLHENLVGRHVHLALVLHSERVSAIRRDNAPSNEQQVHMKVLSVHWRALPLRDLTMALHRELLRRSVLF